MAPPMRGLTQFIVDLRNSKDLEQEGKRINYEINNIQTKFNSDLNGYQRKKYISKLVYIYLLGYSDTVSFGFEESLDLVDSDVYSEKQLGYLALLVFTSKKPNQPLKEHFLDLMDTMHFFLKRDLRSESDDINALAIHFICSSFNTPDENIDHIREEDDESGNWAEIISIVYSFCTSPMSSSILKKKSALALYTFLKLYPQFVSLNENWIPRLITLLTDDDLGIVISCLPLIQFIVTLKTNHIKSIMPPVTKRLHALVVGNECSEKYYYYGTPAPWLIIELLEIVEYCFLLSNDQVPVFLTSELDDHSLSLLQQVTSKSIHNAMQPAQDLSDKNTRSSILFQVVSLVAFIDPSPEAVLGAMHALLHLLNSNETNSRYLSLDALIKLSARNSFKHPISSGISDEAMLKIFSLLHDHDISVRRKALDLLYIVGDQDNYISVVNKLLEYFPYSDFGLKSEIAVKIALLAERFASDSTWYVTTMLKLLSLGGNSTASGISHIGNEVWERIVQIIVNNEELQRKACKLIISLLKKPDASENHNAASHTSENLIKVAAFILGEYGNLVEEGLDTSVNVQFSILYKAYFKVSVSTRAMILSSFLKFSIKFPGELFIRDIVDLFEVERKSIDLEIQTRSYEYLQLITFERDLGERIVKPLPVFEKKENALMTRIGNIQRLTTRSRSSSFVNASKIKRSNNISRNNLVSSSVASLPITEEDLSSHSVDNEDVNPFESDASGRQILSPNWFNGYQRMLHYDEGIFYEDQFIKITYRLLKNNSNISIHFNIINSSRKSLGTNISGMTLLDVQNLSTDENPSYVLSIDTMPASTVVDKTKLEISAKVRDIIEIQESPILSLSFKCGGSFVHLNLKIGLSLLRTLSPSMINIDEFKTRWLQIGELLGFDGEYLVDVNTSHRYNASNIGRIMHRLKFSLIFSSPDESEDTLVMGAGILHTQKSDYGLLVTIKGVDLSKRSFHIIVRCTGGGVAEVIGNTLKEIF